MSEIKTLIAAISIALTVFVAVESVLLNQRFAPDLMYNTVFMLPVTATSGILSYFGLEHFITAK